MTNKLTRKRYNKLLTARNNYYLYGSQLQKGLPMGLDVSTNAYHQYRGTNNLTKMPSVTPSTLDGISLDTPTIEDTRNAGTSSTGERGDLNPIASQLLSAGVSAAGNFLGSALSGGMESGAGNIMQGLGSMASTIPGIGTFVGAGLNVLGGITNGLLGSKMNKENIAKVENNIRELNSFQSNASDYDTLAQNWASSPTGMTFDNSFIGKQGKYSHKVDRKADELRGEVGAGELFVQNTLNNNAANISDAQSRALNSAFIAAYGGPLFADGGSIHIKPENRGKFTETKRRTGKTTEELTHSKNPLTRKRAIFALNSRHWNKHSNGGILDKDEINPGLDAMVKARLALDSHFGNPTARRMTNYDTRSYTFPDGRRGNVYVGSYGNYVTPQIQDVDGELKFIEDPWSEENWERSKAQSMKFESPRDAEYFAKNYKRFAPMMGLYSKGGELNSNSYQVGQVYDIDEEEYNRLIKEGYGVTRI